MIQMLRNYQANRAIRYPELLRSIQVKNLNLVLDLGQMKKNQFPWQIILSHKKQDQGNCMYTEYPLIILQILLKKYLVITITHNGKIKHQNAWQLKQLNLDWIIRISQLQKISIIAYSRLNLKNLPILVSSSKYYMPYKSIYYPMIDIQPMKHNKIFLLVLQQEHVENLKNKKSIFDKQYKIVPFTGQIRLDRPNPDTTLESIIEQLKRPKIIKAVNLSYHLQKGPKQQEEIQILKLFQNNKKMNNNYIPQGQPVQGTPIYPYPYPFPQQYQQYPYPVQPQYAQNPYNQYPNLQTQFPQIPVQQQKPPQPKQPRPYSFEPEEDQTLQDALKSIDDMYDNMFDTVDNQKKYKKEEQQEVQQFPRQQAQFVYGLPIQDENKML